MRSVADIRELVRKFEDQSLLGYEWSHEAHLIVAAVYAAEKPHCVAAMRAGIQSLNAAFGIEQTATRGYHETLTVAWMTLLHHATHADPDANFETRINQAVDQYLDRGAIHRHYTRELLMTPEARFGYVEPDVAPLPEPILR